jgi:hypothetical protein
MVVSTGAWQHYTVKVARMRAAWSGVILHPPLQLLHEGVLAFQMNRQEQQRHRRLMRNCWDFWRHLTCRNAAVLRLQRRINEVRKCWADLCEQDLV